MRLQIRVIKIMIVGTECITRFGLLNIRGYLVGLDNRGL